MKSAPPVIPFSISPDAAEYLCQRLIAMPSEAPAMLVMTMGQTDGQEPPRWLYEGQSFVVGYFEEGENPRKDSAGYEIFGRCITIESKTLKELSGRTLDVRRVDSVRGLFNAYRYVLVAASSPAAGSPLNAGKSPDDLKRKLSIAFLTVLSGFTGVGAAWTVCSIGFMVFNSFEKLLSLFLPLCITGWILGAIIGFFYFRFVFKTGGRTVLAREQIQRKYIGFGGLGFDLSLCVFLGIPILPTLILVFVFWPHVRTPEEKAGVVFAAIMLVFTPCMYFCDRLLRRWVVCAGILGWLLTLALGYWYYKAHGL